MPLVVVAVAVEGVALGLARTWADGTKTINSEAWAEGAKASKAEVLAEEAEV